MSALAGRIRTSRNGFARERCCEAVVANAWHLRLIDSADRPCILVPPEQKQPSPFCHVTVRNTPRNVHPHVDFRFLHGHKPWLAFRTSHSSCPAALHDDPWMAKQQRGSLLRP